MVVWLTAVILLSFMKVFHILFSILLSRLVQLGSAVSLPAYEYI